MQFSLRTLLLAATILPPLIAGGCWLLMDDARIALILALVFGVPIVLVVLWGAAQEFIERFDKQ